MEEYLTKKDLLDFRRMLLADFENLLSGKMERDQPKLVKSSFIRKALDISAGTLFNLRVSGVIKAKKIGGTYYYNFKEVQALFTKK